MLSTRGFRAQLVTQGQRELYDYWLYCAGSRPMPARSDLDPLRSVPKLLPCIGLIDVARGLADAWFRLAGTRLHDIYGEEITGKRVDQIFRVRQRTIGAVCMRAWSRAACPAKAWCAAPCRAGTMWCCSGCGCLCRRAAVASIAS